MIVENAFSTEETLLEHNENLGRKAMNKWFWQNEIKVHLNSMPIINYLRTKMDLDPWTFLIIIELLKKVVMIAAKDSGKRIEELQREDFSKASVYKRSLSLLTSKVEYHYFYNFISTMSPFEKFPKHQWKTIKAEFRHPLVEFGAKILRGTNNENSIRNNYYVQVKAHFQWLCNNIENFKGSSINEISILAITRDHLEEYRAYLIKQVGNAERTKVGAHHHFLYVKRFYTLLYQNRRLPKDIASDIPNIFSFQYKKRNVPSDKEIREFLKVVMKYSDEVTKELLAYSLMYSLALRGIEVCKLKWEEINFSTETISIVQSKSKNGRLPITKNLKELLLKLPRKKKGYIFLDEKFSTPEAYKSRLYQNYKLYAKIAGWNYEGGIHLFRHACITKLAKQDCPLQLLQELARIDMDTLSHYLHMDKPFLQEQISNLNFGSVKKNVN